MKEGIRKLIDPDALLNFHSTQEGGDVDEEALKKEIAEDAAKIGIEGSTGLTSAEEKQITEEVITDITGGN